MLNVGFADDVEHILTNVPQERQTMLFSATMPPWVKNLTQKFLKTPVLVDLVGEAGSGKIAESIRCCSGLCLSGLPQLCACLQYWPTSRVCLIQSTSCCTTPCVWRDWLSLRACLVPAVMHAASCHPLLLLLLGSNCSSQALASPGAHKLCAAACWAPRCRIIRDAVCWWTC